MDIRRSCSFFTNTKNAAQYLKERHGVPVTAGTMEVLRCHGRGPGYRKGNRWVIYQEVELDKFAEGQIVETFDSREKRVCMNCDELVFTHIEAKKNTVSIKTPSSGRGISFLRIAGLGFIFEYVYMITHAPPRFINLKNNGILSEKPFWAKICAESGNRRTYGKTIRFKQE